MASKTIESISVEERATVFSALSDPIRLRILDELASGETCVCTLHQTIDIAPNLLSYHLRVLREAHLVTAVRRGRWVDYTITSTAAATIDAALPADLSGVTAS